MYCGLEEFLGPLFAFLRILALEKSDAPSTTSDPPEALNVKVD